MYFYSILGHLSHSGNLEVKSVKFMYFLRKSSTLQTKYVVMMTTLFAIVLKYYNAVFQCHCWFLFILWCGCWYANMSPSDKKLVQSLMLRWPLRRPLVLLIYYFFIYIPLTLICYKIILMFLKLMKTLKLSSRQSLLYNIFNKIITHVIDKRVIIIIYFWCKNLLKSNEYCISLLSL